MLWGISGGGSGTGGGEVSWLETVYSVRDIEPIWWRRTGDGVPARSGELGFTMRSPTFRYMKRRQILCEAIA
uniref:Uncharacterized protein n=1 Tax=Leersia perrieri TaxID=77586 RepID=A0A0D9X668_9ORYZ